MNRAAFFRRLAVLPGLAFLVGAAPANDDGWDGEWDDEYGPPLPVQPRTEFPLDGIRFYDTAGVNVTSHFRGYQCEDRVYYETSHSCTVDRVDARIGDAFVPIWHSGGETRHLMPADSLSFHMSEI